MDVLSCPKDVWSRPGVEGDRFAPSKLATRVWQGICIRASLQRCRKPFQSFAPLGAADWISGLPASRLGHGRCTGRPSPASHGLHQKRGDRNEIPEDVSQTGRLGKRWNQRHPLLQRRHRILGRRRAQARHRMGRFGSGGSGCAASMMPGCAHYFAMIENRSSRVDAPARNRDITFWVRIASRAFLGL